MKICILRQMAAPGRVPVKPSASNYDVTADGKRFLMVKEGERDAPPTEIRVVLNWAAEVTRIVEAKTN